MRHLLPSNCLRPISNHRSAKGRCLFVRGISFLVVASLFASDSAETTAADFQAKQLADRVDLLENGKLVTSYHFRSGTKPILWPLIGPNETRMSREYPMVPNSKNEAHDHPHHRSLWMTFGEVNEADVWAEGKTCGEVEHVRLLDVQQTSESASVKAEHRWKSNQGKELLTELCQYTISGSAKERIIDCEYILSHPPGTAQQPIHFGDTKEGMFAIRVPESMRGDKPEGEILNSDGVKNGATWGKSAAWVDYSGKATPDAKAHSGIAILVHPSSFNPKGYWHVRTYGLFAHNPIGVKHFLEVNPSATKKEGGYVLPPGQSMHLLYRVVLHEGRWTIEEGHKRHSEFASVTAKLLSAKDKP
jgi:hypothetical protein